MNGEYDPGDAPTHDLDMGGGEIFEVPGVRGRMERLALDSGLILFRVDYRASEDCVLQFEQSFHEPWIDSILHIQGQSIMELPDGRRYTITPDNALLVRVDISGSHFHLQKGQQVRHIGVACTLQALRQQLGGELPDELTPFQDDYGESLVVRSLVPSSRLRQLDASLFAVHANGLYRGMKMEGAALLFMSEVLENHCDPQSESTDLAPWEAQALQDAIDPIRGDLASSHSIQALADNAHLSESRLNQLFKTETGKTCAEFIRGERLDKAQQLLEHSARPVKVVAAEVGYSHVSNFSRAYRARFGEPPARTLRRAIAR